MIAKWKPAVNLIKMYLLNPEGPVCFPCSIFTKKEQAINRAGVVQEDVQPPGLKVWSDPFGRK